MWAFPQSYLPMLFFKVLPIKPAHAQPPAWAGLRYCRARGRLACEDHTGAQMENTERQENNLGKNEERRKTQ